MGASRKQSTRTADGYVVPRGPDPARGREGIIEVWLDDLWWHRKMYDGARWRWEAEDVVDLVTRYTGGQLEFTSMADLEALHSAHTAAGKDASICELAVAEQIFASAAVLGSTAAVADAVVCISELECAALGWFATFDRVSPRSSAEVDTVRRMVSRQPFKNPMIETLELVQLMRFYEAAAAMIDDTLCDLVLELESSRPYSAICAAVGEVSEEGLRLRVDFAQERRGTPGDPRRIPRQQLFLPVGVS